MTKKGVCKSEENGNKIEINYKKIGLGYSSAYEYVTHLRYLGGFRATIVYDMEENLCRTICRNA